MMGWTKEETELFDDKIAKAWDTVLMTVPEIVLPMGLACLPRMDNPRPRPLTEHLSLGADSDIS